MFLCINKRIFFSPYSRVVSIISSIATGEAKNHNIWGPAKTQKTVEGFITVTGFSNRPQITLAHKKPEKYTKLTSQNRAQCSFSPKNLNSLTHPGFFVETKPRHIAGRLDAWPSCRRTFTMATFTHDW